MPKNVAIFGRFCAGKTTLAHELQDEWGFERVSMAQNMKQIVEDAYGTIDKSEEVEVTLPDGTTTTRTIRAVLQSLGENAKGHDLHFWLRWFLRDTETFNAAGIPLVMDDARLKFEAEYLRKNGWILVRVETPQPVRLERYWNLYHRFPTAAEMQHKTETESDEIEVDLVLDGTKPAALLAESVIELSGDPYFFGDMS